MMTERKSDIDSVYLAIVYRMHATLFRMAAKTLEEDFAGRSEPMVGNIRALPFYFLISHSAELLLKCAALKRGASEHEMRHIDFRHDLIALCE
jgi:hypothetical protein